MDRARFSIGVLDLKLKRGKRSVGHRKWWFSQVLKTLRREDKLKKETKRLCE
jgi:hypothetical protein